MVRNPPSHDISQESHRFDLRLKCPTNLVPVAVANRYLVAHEFIHRAGFIVSSPDAPDAQLKFANSRGWRFRMVSHAGTNFAQDMGYFVAEGDPTGWQPGISAFRKDGDRIVRVSDTPLGPGDVFCAAWHIFDLLPAGAAGWEPQYNY